MITIYQSSLFLFSSFFTLLSTFLLSTLFLTSLFSFFLLIYSFLFSYPPHFLLHSSHPSYFPFSLPSHHTSFLHPLLFIQLPHSLYGITFISIYIPSSIALEKRINTHRYLDQQNSDFMKQHNICIKNIKTDF